MAKFEAVDRLMALATEKRADRVAELPNGAASVPGASEGLRAEPGAPREGKQERSAETGIDKPTILSPSGTAPRSKATDRGLQFLQAVRPLLPAAAAAMRLIDHGAVQAVARLLPLLGVGPAAGQSSGADFAEQDQLARSIAELEADYRATRKELQALTLQSAAQEDELRRLRVQVERVSAEQSATAHEVRQLSDRVRLVTAGSIILLMLLISQLVLLVILFHR